MTKLNLTNQEQNLDLLLDYPDALESVKIKIKDAYENN